MGGKAEILIHNVHEMIDCLTDILQNERRLISFISKPYIEAPQDEQFTQALNIALKRVLNDYIEELANYAQLLDVFRDPKVDDVIYRFLAWKNDDLSKSREFPFNAISKRGNQIQFTFFKNPILGICLRDVWLKNGNISAFVLAETQIQIFPS